VAAATDRRIPHIRLNDGNLVQLGHGAKQRRIWTAETDRTSAIAEGIASDKDLTKELLAAVGVPVPQGRAAKDADEAWEIAQDLGLPVVVKPSDGNHGRGVSLDLTERSRGQGRLRARRRPRAPRCWWSAASRATSTACWWWAARWLPPRAASRPGWWPTASIRVQQLIDQQINTDPRRGLTEDFPLNRVTPEEDPVVLQELAAPGPAHADPCPSMGGGC
jgi:cyanophycin synthetase